MLFTNNLLRFINKKTNSIIVLVEILFYNIIEAVLVLVEPSIANRIIYSVLVKNQSL